MAALLPPEELPRHVAIIMDGNRRWARLRDLPELDGHAAGVEAIRALLRHAVRRGVPVLTLYAFSRENWARSDEEVTGLFDLLEAAIRSETEERRKDIVRVVHKRMEEAKVEIRNLRRDAADALKKEERDGTVGTDDAHRQLETLQKTTDRHIADVDRLGAAKEGEVLEV